MRVAILAAALVLSVSSAHSGCEQSCPEPLLTAATAKGDRLLLCGYLDDRLGTTVRVSEFSIFRCADSRVILNFDGTQTAEIRIAPTGLEVVEVSKWPFGENWEWVYVPVREALIDGSDSISWRPRFGKPRLSLPAIGQFVHDYAARVGREGKAYGPDDEVVGKLFAAAATGDSTAKRLFEAMPRDVHLDGAAAEAYDVAVFDRKYSVARDTILATPRRP